jgi:hypothetical protein
MHGAVIETEMTGDSFGRTNPLNESQSDPVFQNYTAHSESHENVGSLLWTWHQIITGRLFDAEGIWLPARLWIFQLGQILLSAFVCAGLFELIKKAVKEADSANDVLPAGLPQWVYDIVPTGREVKFALIPASCVAVVVCASVMLVYIPR